MSAIDIVQTVALVVIGAIAVRAWATASVNSRALEIVAKIFEKRRGGP